MSSEAAMNALKAQTKIKNQAEELGNYLKDMQKWEKTIKLKEKGLKAKPKNRVVPPVRASGGLVPVGATAVPTSTSGNTKPKSKNESAAKHTYDKGYKKWESFDVDAALKDEDGNEAAEEELVPIQTPATVAHAVKASPQAGVQVARPKPALKTPGEREADERQKGNDFFQKGEFEKAIKAYTACLGISNRSVAAFSNRAMCWLKLKEWRKAEMDATLALQIDPKHVKSYQRRAAARNALGMHRAALGDLSQASLSDEQGTFTKALNIDIRKTKELLKSAMRNAPAVSVSISVDHAPIMKPEATTLPPAAPPSKPELISEEFPINVSTDKSEENQVEVNELQLGDITSSSSHLNSQSNGTDFKIKTDSAPKIRTSTTVKLSYSETTTCNETSERSNKSASDNSSSPKPVLTPAIMMHFQYDPTNDENDNNNQMHKLTIDDAEESKSTPVSPSLDNSTRSSSSISSAMKPVKISTSAITATAPKVSDPKGPFELERVWRSCGSDERMKMKVAKKWLRPDGKVAQKIFGKNKNNLGNSCPLDADILCDLILNRVKPLLLAKKRKESNEDFISSISELIKQPKFASSIDFFSASHKSILQDSLEKAEAVHEETSIKNIIAELRAILS